MAGASRASKEGTRFDTDATNATPQKAPTTAQHAMRTFPIGFDGLSLCPSIWAMGLGMRCHRGAGTIGSRYRSTLICQVEGRESAIAPGCVLPLALVLCACSGRDAALGTSALREMEKRNDHDLILGVTHARPYTRKVLISPRASRHMALTVRSGCCRFFHLASLHLVT